jgi:hypothetical protein
MAKKLIKHTEDCAVGGKLALGAVEYKKSIEKVKKLALDSGDDMVNCAGCDKDTKGEYLPCD